MDTQHHHFLLKKCLCSPLKIPGSAFAESQGGGGRARVAWGPSPSEFRSPASSSELTLYTGSHSSQPPLKFFSPAAPSFSKIWLRPWSQRWRVWDSVQAWYSFVINVYLRIDCIIMFAWKALIAMCNQLVILSSSPNKVHVSILTHFPHLSFISKFPAAWFLCTLQKMCILWYCIFVCVNCTMAYIWCTVRVYFQFMNHVKGLPARLSFSLGKYLMKIFFPSRTFLCCLNVVTSPPSVICSKLSMICVHLQSHSSPS